MTKLKSLFIFLCFVFTLNAHPYKELTDYDFQKATICMQFFAGVKSSIPTSDYEVLITKFAEFVTSTQSQFCIDSEDNYGKIQQFEYFIANLQFIDEIISLPSYSVIEEKANLCNQILLQVAIDMAPYLTGEEFRYENHQALIYNK